MKKKLAVLILSSAMLATSIAGLAGCGGKGASRRNDPRAADAYEAYDYEGTKVGAYRTLSDAINATVNADLDLMEDNETEAGTYGGYVTKKGSTRKLFRNRKGYSAGNSDQFWYYENGKELAGYDCWDNTNSLAALHNQKVVTYSTGNMGTSSMQSWNGYGLLDAQGNEISADRTMAQSWELSSPMDAGVMMFPARKKGVSGLKYKFDLSKIQITPAYKGVNTPVYAFIGFYAWQDYYVVAMGIACDTTTGDWYYYEGSSRDDSFSDVQYKLGKKLMGSKWTKTSDGGYFTPQVKELEMEIKTVKKVDTQYDDETYWVDEMKITFDGKNTTTKVLDDATLSNHFSGLTVSADNGFVFTAGLDIKNDIASGSSTKVENVDYFNGAKFLNLAVKEAGIYFPTEEEITNQEYAIGTIEDDLRGLYHDALLANDTVTPNTYDYTILNNYMCTTYEAKDGLDMYSFRFDGEPVSENELGGDLKTAQDKIDRLAQMTVENINDYLADYDKVTEWYGVDDKHSNSQGVKQAVLNLLDFSVYTEAKKVYEQSFNITDEGKAVLKELNELPVLTAYGEYKGWEAPAGASIRGYLWSEAQEFGKLLTRYNALSATDKTNVLRLYNGKKAEFDNWSSFYTEVAAYLANTTYTSKTYKAASVDISPDAAKEVTYTGTEALQKLFQCGFEVWTKKFDNQSTDAHVMDSDGNGNFYRSFHLLFLRKQFEEQNVEIPSFFEDVLLPAITSTDRSMAFYNDFEYIYAVLTQAARIYKLQQEGKSAWLDKELADMVNDYMVGFDKFTEDGFNWNMNNGATSDIRDTNMYYELYFGLPDARDFKANLKYVIDVVKAGDTTAEVNATGLGFKNKVTALTEDPAGNGSEAAKAIAERIKALGKLSDVEYTDWTAFKAKLDEYAQIVADRADLDAKDNAYINATTSVSDYQAWGALADSVNTISSVTTKLNTLSTALGTEKKDYTATEAMAEIIRLASLIKSAKVDPSIPSVIKPEDPATSYERDTADQVGEGRITFVGHDRNYITSARLCSFVQFFRENNITLPTYVEDLLTAVQFNDYYEQTYLPLYNVVQLAQVIASKPVEKVEDLTTAQLDLLNEIWTAGYTPEGKLGGWLSTKTQFQYYGYPANAGHERTQCIVNIAGGTLKAEDGETPLWIKEYIDVVGEKVASWGYTRKDNGWGVTNKTIANVTLTEGQLEILNEFSNYTVMPAYVEYKGYIAPDENVKGYLYSELQAFKALYAKFEALPEAERTSVMTVLDVESWNGWVALKNANLQENYAGFENASLELTVTPMGTETKVYEGVELVGELYRWAIRISNGTQFVVNVENDDANALSEGGGGVPSTICRVGNTTYPALRMVKIYQYCVANEIEIPAFVQAELTRCGFADYLEVYEAITGTAQLAARIESGDVKTMADTRTSEFSTLNRFWTNGYELNYLIRWNWSDPLGNKFETYYNSRTLAMIKAAGITETKSKTNQYFAVVADWLTKQGFTVKENGWGTTATAFTGGGTIEDPVTPSEPTYTQPEGSLLPSKASDFDAANGVTVTAASDKITLVNSKDDSPQNKAPVNKTFTIAGNAVFFDAEAVGTGKYDLVIYAGGTYTSIAKILANDIDAAYDLKINKGYIPLADVVRMLNTKKAGAIAADATELTITDISVCTGNLATVAVKEFRVAAEPTYTQPEGSLLPEYASDFNAANGVLFTAESDKITVVNSTDDSPQNKAPVNKTFTIAGNAVIFDAEAIGSGVYDLVIYAGGTYTSIAKILANNIDAAYDLNVKKGYVLLTDVVRMLNAKKENAIAADATELTITDISVCTGNLATVTVKEFRVGAIPKYTQPEGSLLPEYASDFNAATGVTVTAESNKITLANSTDDAPQNKATVNKTFTIAGNAVYFDAEAIGTGAYDLVIYAGGTYTSIAKILANDINAAYDLKINKGYIPLADVVTMLNTKKAGAVAAEATELTIEEISICTGNLATVAVKEFRVAAEPTYTQPEGSLLPEYASDFDPSAGVMFTAESDKITAVNLKDDSPQNKAPVNKTFTIAGNAVFFDAEAIGSGVYDLVIYAGGTYTSIAKILANSKDADYDLKIKKGYVSLADVVTMLNAKKENAIAADATELTITDISVCTGNYATVVVKEFRVAEEPTYTQPEGSLLPEYASDFNPSAGVMFTAESDKITVVNSTDDGPQNKATVNKTFTIARNAIYFDAEAIGEGQYDLVIYAGGTYTSIAKILANSTGAAYDLKVKKGYVLLTDVVRMLNAKKENAIAADATQLTIEEISICTGNYATVVVKEFRVAAEPTYTQPEGSLLPEYASDFNAATGVKVTAKSDKMTLVNSVDDAPHNIALVNKTFTIAGNAVFFDAEAIGTGAYDLVIYAGGTYTTIAKILANSIDAAYDLKIKKGYVSLTDVVAMLNAKKENAIAADATELTITQISVCTGNYATVAVKEFRVAAEPTYTQPEGSLLPSKASDFDSSAGVMFTAESDKITAVNLKDDSPQNKAPVNKTFTIAGNAVYFDAEAIGEGQYDLVIYAGGTYTTIAKILANSKDAAYDLQVKKGYVLLTDVVRMLNAKKENAVAADATELTITDISVCTGNYATVAVKEFRVAAEPTYTQPEGSLLPGKASDFNPAAGVLVMAESDKITVVNPLNDGPQNKATVNKTFTIADNAVYFDAEAIGTGAYDLVIYAGGTYTSIAKILANSTGAAYDLKVEKGYVLLTDVVRMLNAKKENAIAADATQLTIEEISICTGNYATVAVKEFKVVAVTDILPTSGYEPDAGATTETVKTTVEGTGVKVVNQHGGAQNIASTGAQPVAIEGNSIYFDLEGETGSSYDIVLYCNGTYTTIQIVTSGDANAKYSMDGKHVGSITMADLYTWLKAKKASAFTGEETELTIDSISIYTENGTTVHVRSLYIAPTQE